MCAIIGDDQVISQIRGYTFTFAVWICQLDGLTGELQWIDGEIFGKTASVNADTGYVDTGSVCAGTCPGVIGIRKCIVNIFF